MTKWPLVFLLMGGSVPVVGQYAPIKSILEVEGPVNSGIALGSGIKGLGDANGDGKPDFAVSAWNAKKTYIYYGGLGILDGIPDDSIPGGGAIESGDLNGDGVVDLVIKANGDTSYIDLLYIFFGTKIHSGVKFDTIPSVILRQEKDGTNYGSTFAIGDLNADGYDDLVVGAWDYEQKGKVYLYLGGKNFSGSPTYTGNGDTFCTSYGLNVNIGDINGDGIGDLVIGTKQQSYCNISDSGYVGSIDVFYGKTNWVFLRSGFDFQLKYESRISNLSQIFSFSLVDINADGIEDIAFPGESGKMYFLFGRRSALSSSPDVVIRRDPNDYDSFSYTGPATNVGDINNDGKDDYVIRAFSSGQECLHLFLGNSSPQTLRVAGRCKGTTNAFSVVVPLGDVNGDGVNDFGSVAPNNLFPPNDGYLVVFSGDPSYVTTVRRVSSGTPAEVDLEQNYPNPFNPTTTITYSLKSKRHVVLKIFDSSGREIRRLVSEVQPMGDHKVVWDGTNRSGARVASGIYFYRLQVDNTTVTKKALYIR